MLTAPNINKGPDVLVNDISLLASILVINFSSLSLDVSLAPTGYPDITAMDIGKAPSPGKLNKGPINGLSNLPIKSTKPSPINISDIIKKGRSEGITILNHIERPDAALLKERLGLVIIPIKATIINKKNNIFGMEFL
jgi:hypothetical protein